MCSCAHPFHCFGGDAHHSVGATQSWISTWSCTCGQTFQPRVEWARTRFKARPKKLRMPPSYHRSNTYGSKFQLWCAAVRIPSIVLAATHTTVLEPPRAGSLHGPVVRPSSPNQLPFTTLRSSSTILGGGKFSSPPFLYVLCMSPHTCTDSSILTPLIPL